ncbi:hypothetical protein L6164_017114 [Bauhinia variegata]|uniref:Uncharacterized protein n=1 Tax=Bauhinia variegata TaxID=167791 RepID=A0ACB9N8R8_BAUVA|nr:hypothetical protein L6164_017114 [Bauhinia variegata]
MNLQSLSLVITSLAAVGVFCATTEAANNHRESTIIKEGNRVIVVEYDQDGHRNTRIKISPQTHDEKLVNFDSGGLENAKGKIKKLASAVPNKGQGHSVESDSGAFLQTPKELICGGECKEKVAGAMEKAKEKVSETAHHGIDKKKEIAHEILARKKETAREVGRTAAKAVGKARETASHAAHSVKETTKQSMNKAKDILHDAVDKGVTLRSDFRGNVADDALKMVRGAKQALKMNILNSMMGVFNLMGFSIAYGLCIWVTFISSYVLSRAMPRQQFGMVQSKISALYFKAMAYSIGLALLGHVLSHSKSIFTGNTETLQLMNLLGSLLTVFVNSVYLSLGQPSATSKEIERSCVFLVPRSLYRRMDVMLERMRIEKGEGRGREDIASERSSKGGDHQHPAGQTESATTTGISTAMATAEAATSTGQNAVRSRILRLTDKLKKLNSYSSFLNILTLLSLTWHLVYLAQRLQICSKQIVTVALPFSCF